MLSKKVGQNIYNSLWIRAMFEDGEKLRKIYGDENVFDYCLGNPDYEPDRIVINSIQKNIKEKNIHKYTNNAGIVEVRKKVAENISKNLTYHLDENNILMTCGAAGALNVIFQAILDPGDEVITFSPFFVDYKFYVENHQGRFILSPANQKNFQPVIDELERKITKNCKAIIINSPNNPTGVVYSEKILREIQNILRKKENEYNKRIFIISDEPYKKLVYDNYKIPDIINIFKNAIIVNSFSKSHALPGERIGYIAVSPRIENFEELMDGLVFSNRVLGFVNAPSLFQRVISETLDLEIDMSEYNKRRDYLYSSLIELGYECVKPQGAFYLFPKSLIEDDVEFAQQALKYNLLIVPGKGFGCPGHFRLAYCISFEKIKKSINSFEKLANHYK